MANVVISNRSIFNQRIRSIENNKVLLPFNVSKNQIKKLVELLQKIQVTFLSDIDKLNIGNLTYGNIIVKPSSLQISNGRFTLSKTYVVTMKQNFIEKVKSFYDRIETSKTPERPVFSIGKETNLQEALAEATTEIDLSAINTTLNNNVNLQPTAQVLANNPLGETVIDNPVNLNQQVQQHITQPEVNTVEQQSAVEPIQPTPVNVQAMQEVQNVGEQPVPELNVEQPKKLVKKLKGNVLAVPIVAAWLGLVFYGTLKLVTNILT